MFAEGTLILLSHILVRIILFYLTTVRIVLWITSFYLVVVGTWRLANATIEAPIGTKLFEYGEKEESYNPLSDLIAVREICLWFFNTIKSFKSLGGFRNAVLLHKHFNWGLMWLLLGIILQFFSQLCGFIGGHLATFYQSW